MRGLGVRFLNLNTHVTLLHTDVHLYTLTVNQIRARVRFVRHMPQFIYLQHSQGRTYGFVIYRGYLCDRLLLLLQGAIYVVATDQKKLKKLKRFQESK